ncbi:dephospho-CoA kinase [Paracrocinitomix mangrovi]|uniref:dephospho-CoA kinase n=1 Tax=Paracrocinitomix mangrovi TaxID=2862509 RepID=UPI001C8EF40E|nr:dephospho-CoA kinase [Paracrocinitomix mangrovi]UKN02977.1 dephospho-CoA kinase [Paracrocinitomix mangrovi]
MKTYLSIGITGGIGSGKSYVCRIIEAMGYPVFYSDQEAKNITNSHPKAIEQITILFGKEAYIDQALNSPFIAEQVFNDPNLRLKLNEIVHPLVRDKYFEWAESSGAKLVFNEAAILFETGAYKQYDKMCLIVAPKQMRIDRVKKRSGLSEEQILERMSSQWTDEQKIPLADFVINNDEKSPLLPQINKMIQQLK